MTPHDHRLPAPRRNADRALTRARQATAGFGIAAMVCAAMDQHGIVMAICMAGTVVSVALLCYLRLATDARSLRDFLFGSRKDQRRR